MTPTTPATNTGASVAKAPEWLEVVVAAVLKSGTIVSCVHPHVQTIVEKGVGGAENLHGCLFSIFVTRTTSSSLFASCRRSCCEDCEVDGSEED